MTQFTATSPNRGRSGQRGIARRWGDWNRNLKVAGVLGMSRLEKPNALGGVGRWRFSLVKPRGFGVTAAIENLEVWERMNRRPVLFIRGPGVPKDETLVLLRADDFLDVFGGYTQHLAAIGRLGGDE